MPDRDSSDDAMSTAAVISALPENATRGGGSPDGAVGRGLPENATSADPPDNGRVGGDSGGGSGTSGGSGASGGSGDGSGTSGGSGDGSGTSGGSGDGSGTGRGSGDGSGTGRGSSDGSGTGRDGSDGSGTGRGGSDGSGAGRGSGGGADGGSGASAAEDFHGGELGEVERPAGDQAGFRLAAFGALLIVVLFAGYGLGRLNNGTASPPAVGGGAATGAVPGMVMDESQQHAHASGGASAQAAAGAAVGGLSLSSGGLTLVPTRTDFAAGRPQRLGFRIAGAGGAAVTTYVTVHEKLLHLVVVRRDLTGFQHLHPTMAADGTWSIDLTLAEPGIYRMIADFTAVVGGRQIAATLGGDLTVAGNYSPRGLPAPVQAVDTEGFTVTYAGTPSTESTQPIMVGVAGAGGGPARLEPYLGTFGHLVVMRQGDLAYVHVHPEAQLVDGKVKFWVAMPSAGTYRMFFDFQVAGKVHTATWTTVLG